MRIALQRPPALGDSPAGRLLYEQYTHIFLNEVVALVPVLNETKHSFALYTPERTRQRWPVRLAATTEQDMNDWVSGRWSPRAGERDSHSGAAWPGLLSSDQRCATPARPAQPVLLREPESAGPPIPAGHLVHHLQGRHLRERAQPGPGGP